MSCDATTCCFFSSLTSTVDCWGAPYLLYSTSIYPLTSNAPTVSVPSVVDCQNIVSMAVRSGFVCHSPSTNSWTYYNMMSLNDTQALNISGALSGPVSSYSAGLSHIVAMVGSSIYVSGWDDAQYFLTTGYVMPNFQPVISSLSPFQLMPFSGTPLLVSAWSHSIIVLDTTGSLHVAGFLFTPGAQFDPSVSLTLPFNNSFTPLPYSVPSGYAIDQLYNRRVFNYYYGLVSPPEPVFIVHAKKTSAASGCAGSPPFSTCTCVFPNWICIGDQSFSSTTIFTIDKPFTVVGDWLITTPNLVLNISQDLLNSYLSNARRSVAVAANSGAIVQVTGCANITSPITIAATNLTFSVGNTSLAIVSSSCAQSNVSSTFTVPSSSSNPCLTTSNHQATDSSSQRTTLSVLFDQRSSCGSNPSDTIPSSFPWWAILVATIGGVIVVVVIIVIVFMSVKKARSRINPYHNTN